MQTADRYPQIWNPGTDSFEPYEGKVTVEGTVDTKLTGSNVSDGTTINGVSYVLDDNLYPVLRTIDAAPFAYDEAKNTYRIEDLTGFQKKNYLTSILKEFSESSVGSASEYLRTVEPNRREFLSQEVTPPLVWDKETPSTDFWNLDLPKTYFSLGVGRLGGKSLAVSTSIPGGSTLAQWKISLNFTNINKLIIYTKHELNGNGNISIRIIVGSTTLYGAQTIHDWTRREFDVSLITNTQELKLEVFNASGGAQTANSFFGDIYAN